MWTGMDSQEFANPLLDLIEQGARVAGESYADDSLDPATLVPMRARGNQFGIAGTYSHEDITRGDV